MNVDSILLSEYATLTDRSQLSVIRVFNQLGAPDFPATQRWMALSLLIHAHRDEAGTEHEIEIRLRNGSGTVDASVHKTRFTLVSADPPEGMPLRHTYIHQMVNVQFPEEGTYAFEVFIDGTYHASTSLHLERRK